MSTVTENEAKAQLPKLLAQAGQSGQTIVNCRDATGLLSEAEWSEELR